MVFQEIALLFLAAAIVLGFVRKINVGIVSLGLAFVLGMIGGVDTKVIFNGFPSKLFITLLGTMFFFCLLQENHTLELLSKKMVTLVGTHVYLIPVIIYAVSYGLSAAGPGAISVQSVMIIFAVSLAVQMDTSPVLMACMAILGAVGGTASPIALSGIIVTDLTAEFGFSGMAAPVFAGVTAANLLCAVLLYVAYKGYKLKSDHAVSASDLPAFNRQQKMGIAAILVLVIAVVGFQYDVGLVSFALALALILICGVNVLMSVTKEMGGIELLSNLLASMMNQVTAAPLIGLTAGIMSWFSSANGVVLPTLIPTVPDIVSNVGGSTSVLEMVMSIVGGATVAGISPLSTGGSLLLASYTQETDASEKVQQSLFARLFALSFSAVMVIVIFALAGGFKLFC